MVPLVVGWCRYTVNGCLEEAASEPVHELTSIDDHSSGQVLYKLPLAVLLATDLEGAHGLRKEEGEGAKVRMSTKPYAFDGLLLLGRVLVVVLHISHPALIVDVKLVHVDKGLFR